MKRTTSTLTVEGKTLTVSNLQKVLYPATGFTKGDLIKYYLAIAPVLLPHLKDRALTMKRYPDGVRGFFFYEKNCPAHRPSWVQTAQVLAKGKGAPMAYCLANNLPSLVWMANLADLELHTSLARSRQPDRPTVLVFDLDPGEGATILECVRVGQWIREKLAALGLQCFPKVSGSKGLQLYVPLNTAVSFDETKAAARRLAETVAAEHPDQVVAKMRKDLRRGKVLIDWSQNDDFKTTVCVYSPRAKEEPFISTPLTWEEVASRARSRRPEKFQFRPADVLARVEEHGDLFAPVLTLRQKLPR